MANFLTDAYRNSVIGKTSDYSARVDLDTDTLKAIFIDEGTDTGTAADIFMSGLTSGSRNPTFANAPTLGGVTLGTVAAGVFDANDLTFTGSSVLTGSTTVEALAVFKFVSVDTDSPFLGYWNSGVTGLPLTPNGGDVTVAWNASGIWKF